MLLGLVHGRVGVAQQLLGGDLALAAVGDRDADARAQEPLAPVELERALDLGGDAVGDPAQIGEAHDPLEQDHELVPAEAGDRVAGPDRRGEALGGRDQQLVAGAVAERVVDDLEVVDVGEQDGEAGVGLAAALERLGQRAVEQRAVRQPGQRIVVRLVVEPLGVLLASGDVDALADVVVGVGGDVADQRVAPDEPAEAAVGADVALLLLGAFGLGRPALAQRRAVRDRGVVPEGDGAGAGALAQLLVGLQHLAVGRDERHRHRRGVEDASEPFVGVRGRGAGALVGAPRDQVGDGQRGHEQAVDGRPAPRGAGLVVEDGTGLPEADHAVLQHDEGDRQQVRPPLLVERQRADHHEVVEVGLDRPVPGHDDQRRAGEERHRAHRGAPAAREPGRPRGEAEGRWAEVERPGRGERPALADRERRQQDQVHRENQQETAMTRRPDLGR